MEGRREDEPIMPPRTSQPFLVTLWTYGIEPLFTDSARTTLFLHILGGLRQKLGFRLHAYVVLPDRVRLILGSPGGDLRAVRLTVQRLKSRFAREVNARSGRLGLVWQDADQTLPLASADEVRRRADFLHYNPVMAGLARDPGDWRWSSYRAWAGRGRTPLAVDLLPAEPALPTSPAAGTT
jgi:REP-associated tyrosine transposase